MQVESRSVSITEELPKPELGYPKRRYTTGSLFPSARIKIRTALRNTSFFGTSLRSRFSTRNLPKKLHAYKTSNSLSELQIDLPDLDPVIIQKLVSSHRWKLRYY